MLEDQALYFSSVSEIFIVLVLMNQPNIVFTSSNHPSADNFMRERRSSRFIGSQEDIGRPKRWIARGTA